MPGRRERNRKRGDVDEVDLRITEILEEDASLPYAEIARRLGLDESTVRKRVAALKRAGVIKKFTIVVDPRKLGFGAVALVGVDVEPHALFSVAEELARLSEVRYVATSTGDHMIMAEIWAKDGRELAKILSDKVGSMPGVRRVCPSVVLERLK